MSFVLSQFLEKARAKDKDLRHMALYDLHQDLQKDTFKLDESTQRQVADEVLLLLDDVSAEVQGIAVRCLGHFVKKMSQLQIENCVGNLCKNITEGKEEKRNIATIALKTIITEIPKEIAASPIKRAITPLAGSLQGDSQEVKLDVLDVMCDILSRFGALLSSEHEKLQTAFAKELTNGRPPIRKRAITCLASLSIHSADRLFTELVDKVLSGIEKTSGGETLRTYIQLVSAISRSAGSRLGKSLDRVVPILLKSAEGLGEEGETDVRENILQAFESFVVSCPSEVTPYVDQIIDLCKEYLAFDPNYTYEDSDDEDEEDADDEDADMEDADEDEDEDEDDGDNDISDDDDTSWKVRRAAAKCISSVIKTRPDYLKKLYEELCSEEDKTLIRRFKEREQNVKLDILQVFSDLLNHSVFSSGSLNISASTILNVTQRPEVAYVQQIKGFIIKRLSEQLKEKSVDVRAAIFNVLKDLVVVLKGGLERYVAALVPHIQKALTDRASTSTIKIPVLSFLHLLLATHAPATFTPHADKLCEAVYAAARDRNTKIITEALVVCGELVKVVVTLKATDSGKFAKHTAALYDTVFERLKTQDIDQTVKEAAINAIGLVIAQLGDKDGLGSERLGKALPVLLDRLRNEITRQTAAKTFSVIAQSPLRVDLSPILAGVITELGSFLRKNNRALRQAALVALNDITRAYGPQIDGKLFTDTVAELAELITEADIHLSHVAIDLAASVLAAYPRASAAVERDVLPRILDLLRSSTLQGVALASVLALFRVLVPLVGFQPLFQAVLSTVSTTQQQQQQQQGGEKVSKQVYSSVAKAIAALTASASASERDATVQKFIRDLQQPQSDSAKILALFALGEIGMQVDLSTTRSVQQDIATCFDSGSEEIKNAASFALGAMSVGNLPLYLPFIVAEIRRASSRKYLLINSLREIIARAGAGIVGYVDEIVPLLFEFAENSEEGVRNVVAECLGKLALVAYERVMPQLRAALGGSDEKRCTVVSAVKAAITEQPQQVDTALQADIGDFLALLAKPEKLAVRRAAVLLLTAAVHNKPRLVVERLDALLPRLYAETVFDEANIKVIDLGPFKHREDLGLELRKAAFECMDTILESSLALPSATQQHQALLLLGPHVDVNDFVARLPNGLADPNQDIRMLTHLMVAKLAAAAPAAIGSALDTLLPPIKETLGKKLSENEEQERDRHEDLLRSALRAVDAIARLVPAAEDNARFSDILNSSIRASPTLLALYKTVSANGNTGAAADSASVPSTSSSR